MWQTYYSPDTIDEAIRLLSKEKDHARIIAGATDLILEMENGIRPNVRVLIDLTRIPGLDRVVCTDEGFIHLGPLVTHNHCAGSPIIQASAFALAKACWEVGAPQIRNRGTVAGNLITASPANDSITPLMALKAQVTLRSINSERVVPLKDFYVGVRKTVMREDEVLVGIDFPLPSQGTMSTFSKLALRRAQAISVINLAVVLKMDGEVVEEATITLGAVAPTVIHAPEVEAFLKGKTLTPDVIEQAGHLTADAARPIDDLRGSAFYRKEMVRVCAQRALQDLSRKQEREGFPVDPVMLWGAEEWHWDEPLPKTIVHESRVPIETTINGIPHVFNSGHDKSLLRLIREEAGLPGTKEGCAEGECGACTVFLDGMAVMSCLVPAPRAHKADIVTIEGLVQDGKLHPIQQAFIDQGGVQCGYCTPGFLMSGAKLLEERPLPNQWEIKQSITGNLCRCTGYYKILKAFEEAAAKIRDE